ncbi:zeta toxin family protein [Microbacter sp. GSS18]|nr:zeta toxin family protein [Microbacter sp. GSS18]
MSVSGSAWRLGDAGADTAMREAAAAELARLIERARENDADLATATADVASAYRDLVAVDGFDRREVEAAARAFAGPPVADAVAGAGGVLDEAAVRAVLETQVLPVVFPPGAAEEHPTLVVVAGQPGAGQARAIGRVASEYEGGMAVVRAGDLRAFYPPAADPRRYDGAREEAVSTASAAWLQGCLGHARAERRSMLLEGSFPNPGTVLAVADRFAKEGFRTRLVLVGARRAESLLTLTSGYLRNVREGVPATPVDRGAHERAWEATLALAGDAETSTGVGRVSVLDRSGVVVFDGEGDRLGARAGLVAAEQRPLTVLQSAAWLGELRRVTEFARGLRNPPREVMESLLELHQAAIREIVPELPLPRDSDVATVQLGRHAEQVVGLRRLLAPREAVDRAAPVVAVAGPERGGVSR